MNIKNTLLVLAISIIGATHVYATCPGTNPSLHQQYLCKRFVTINYSGETHRIDFSKVATVFQNVHDHAKYTLTPAPPWPAHTDHYYMLFDNGKWILFDQKNCTPKPADAWDDYRNFLIENPSFIRF